MKMIAKVNIEIPAVDDGLIIEMGDIIDVVCINDAEQHVECEHHTGPILLDLSTVMLGFKEVSN